MNRCRVPIHLDRFIKWAEHADVRTMLAHSRRRLTKRPVAAVSANQTTRTSEDSAMLLSHTTNRTTIHLRSLAVAALAALAACGDSSLTTSRQRTLPADRPVLNKLLSS